MASQNQMKDSNAMDIESLANDGMFAADLSKKQHPKEKQLFGRQTQKVMNTKLLNPMHRFIGYLFYVFTLIDSPR